MGGMIAARSDFAACLLSAYIRPMPVHIARLPSRALVRISGRDARPWLHHLLSQDVETLAAGQLRFGALLAPQGRLLFDLVLLDVAADRRDALIQRLTMYRLRAAVEIAPVDAPVHAAWNGSPDGFTPDPRLPALGGRAYGGDPAETAGEADYDAWRLVCGAPDPARDATPDKTYPIEANFDLLNGIDFSKGCFVGQETTSRMKRRGTIPPRMATLAFDGPPPLVGTEVLNGELRAGEVLTGTEGRAMAQLRLDRLDGDLTVDDRPVRVDWPGWMARPPA